eukprot:1762127-Rhodomonas_salina.1
MGASARGLGYGRSRQRGAGLGGVVRLRHRKRREGSTLRLSTKSLKLLAQWAPAQAGASAL